MDTSHIKLLKSAGHVKYDYLFKILIIGSSGVGKSSLLSRFANSEFKIDSKATIGVEFSTKIMQIGDKIVKAQIWDTAGQERFRSIASSFYRGAVGTLVCFDLTNSQSYMDVDKWLDEIVKYSSSCDIQFGEGSTVMLVGNKTDLRHLRVISEEEGRAVVERRELGDYIETSAADTTNVEEAFLKVIGLAYKRLEDKNNQADSRGSEGNSYTSIRPSGIRLKPNDGNQNGDRCC